MPDLPNCMQAAAYSPNPGYTRVPRFQGARVSPGKVHPGPGYTNPGPGPPSVPKALEAIIHVPRAFMRCMDDCTTWKYSKRKKRTPALRSLVPNPRSNPAGAAAPTQASGGEFNVKCNVFVSPWPRHWKVQATSRSSRPHSSPPCEQRWLPEPRDP